MMRRGFLAVFVGMALVGAMFLGGCASLSEGDTGAKAAIQLATYKVIDEDVERAQRVYSISSSLQEGVDGNTTLQILEDRVREEIDWSKLDPAETQLVTILIGVVRSELEERIQDGVLDPEEEVAVRNVLQWIQQAAQMAGGGGGVS